MEQKITNAQRFLTAYNAIDSVLRSMYGFKRTMTYSDVIRRSVLLNSVVRKYEDDLIDYGRLRNAIVHKSNANYVIAEPHLDVVEKMESLAHIISTPPLALDRISNKDVLCLKADDSIKYVMELITRSGYSNLPVYKNEQLIGVANGQRLLDVIGNASIDKIDLDDFVRKTNIGSVLPDMNSEKYYAVADENLTIENTMHLFEQNRKLMVVLITNQGSLKYPPLGIITMVDVIEMQKVLDVY